MIAPLLVPYLMGQRRDGLQRVEPLRGQSWQVVTAPQAVTERITDKSEQMRSMARVYARLAAAVKPVVLAGGIPCSIAGDCVSTRGSAGIRVFYAKVKLSR